MVLRVTRRRGRGPELEHVLMVLDDSLPERLVDRFGTCALLAVRALEQALGAARDRKRRKRSVGRGRALAIARWMLRVLVPYRLRSGVRLAPPTELALADLAARFHVRTGRRLLATSGLRGAWRQARAMYIKLRLGVRITRVYRHRALAREISRAYRRARRAGRSRVATIAAMAKTIERLACQGLFISEHQRASAVDVRSRGLTRRQRRALRRVVRRLGGRVELREERRPPHFHLVFHDVPHVGRRATSRCRALAPCLPPRRAHGPLRCRVEP